HLITIIFSSLFFIFIYILKSIMQITNLNLLFELILVGCFGLLSTFPFYSKEERRSFMLMLKRKV
ncbi:hypothetical protein CKL36_004377, partial [Escherichia coli]|nr:hypothetical protein [Escherichia coli]EFD2799059.1 hypothetical protein [Escherichia coli]